MKRVSLAVLSLAFAPVLGAQEAGDLVVNSYNGARLDVYSPDGTLVASTAGSGTGATWQGAAVTPEGRLATVNRVPSNGINVFEANGQLVTEFTTPQLSTPGDLDVFADGTFAVCDYPAGEIELYAKSGTYLGNFTAPGLTEPLGCFVDSSDVLWVAGNPGVYRFDRAGNHLGTLPTVRYGDLVVLADGTFWAVEFDQARVVRLDSSGAQLTSFATNLIGNQYGIALGFDGTIHVTAWPRDFIYRFDQSGNALSPFALPNNTGPLFLGLLGEGASSGIPYCTGKANSLGCVPAIRSSGAPRASKSSGFSVSASNVRNAKVGLLLYTLSGRTVTPFQGGVLCLAAPVLRTPPAYSGGPPPPIQNCGGGWRIDMNAFAAGLSGGAPHPSLRIPGTFVHCQWWGRDPGDAVGSALTDALQYEVAP